MFRRPTSGSIVCPRCGSLVGVRDARCYRCGYRNPGLWGFAPLLQRLGLDLHFTDMVLFACGALYVITLLAEPSAIGRGGLLSLLSPGQRPLFLFGASGALPVFGYGRWWTVLSAAWLHGGLLHIAMNMLWLRQLMPAVAHLYGNGRLILIYTAASVAGFGLTSVMGVLSLPGPLRGAVLTVGASAPLFGLFGALVVHSRASGHTALGEQVWRWVLMFLLLGLLIPFVDNWAHVGGFAGGWLAARALDPAREESATELLLGLVCLGLQAAAIVASVLTGLALVR